MRLKIDSHPPERGIGKGRNWIKTYVSACSWPRDLYSRNGKIKSKEIEAACNRDREQVRAYMASHPGCSRWDVELECHLGKQTALRLIREIKNESTN